MAEHLFTLLGPVNQTTEDLTLRGKYIVRVTADQLAGLLQYERRGAQKAAPYRISGGSSIQIDKTIQRGQDEAGYLQQQPSKIADIKKTLLGESDAQTRFGYLGSLVWNVRKPGATLEVVIMQSTDASKPPQYKLRIETEAFFLTDSAHRHFGIVEALKAYRLKPSSYPRFKPAMEFAVEIYNLDKAGERELFYELNGKQKKASPTKLRELDVSSPIGALRDAIIAHDEGDRRLLEMNIEVTSVQNKHTLMTMSVFASTITEVFAKDELRQAREEEGLREDCAQYYCEFLYKLRDTIVVRCDLTGSGSDEDVSPFRNLHQEVIRPVMDNFDPASPDESQKKLDAASEQAKSLSDRLRANDITNNNATLKALFRIAGRIRQMSQWTAVIDRLQSDLIAPMNGKFFQRENPGWFVAPANDVPIASINEDKSINVQVQPKTVNRIFDYLCGKLDLEIPATVATSVDGGPRTVLADGAVGVWDLQTNTDNIKSFDLHFVVPRAPLPYDDEIKLAIDSDWKDANFKGAKRLKPTLVREDKSYQHPTYPDLIRYTASFEVSLPAASRETTFKLVFSYPDLDRSERKKTITLYGPVPT
jgi:hypothetical protein